MPERPDSPAAAPTAPASGAGGGEGAAGLLGLLRAAFKGSTRSPDTLAVRALGAIRAAPPAVVAAALGWEQYAALVGQNWRTAWLPPAAGAGGDVGTDDEGATT